MAMTLGYWDIRGLAHAIRLLLEYTDTNYEERQYSVGDAPDYDRSQWLDEKFKLGLDFPNLPYLIDGTHKLTQSNAILRYIARKHNLCEWVWSWGQGHQWPCPGLGCNGRLRVNLCCVATGGETEEEMIRVDILENQVMDVRLAMARICYSPDFEKLKPGFLKEIPEKIKLFSEFLGKRPWFAGDKLTYVDFLVYDVLDMHRIFEPKCLDAFPNLKDFISRFEGLKKISAYMKSSRFLPGPLFMKLAVWGNK
uniref:Glutathione S-transferase n=1 Tax=Bos indicus x Bos taurus TaxID=30522 RepID=A0A4W2D2P4_BOBOX